MSDDKVIPFKKTGASEETPQTSDETLSPGVYRHYKGGNYAFICMSVHEATKEILVTYRELHGAEITWTRPKSEFVEKVMHEGKLVPRFELVKRAHYRDLSIDSHPVYDTCSDEERHRRITENATESFELIKNRVARPEVLNKFAEYFQAVVQQQSNQIKKTEGKTPDGAYLLSRMSLLIERPLTLTEGPLEGRVVCMAGFYTTHGQEKDKNGMWQTQLLASICLLLDTKERTIVDILQTKKAPHLSLVKSGSPTPTSEQDPQ